MMIEGEAMEEMIEMNEAVPQFTLSQPMETTEMKDFSKFTITEPIETTEIKDFSKFTITEHKGTPEMKDFSKFTITKHKETPETKDFSKFTITEHKETPEMKDFSKFTITEHKETPEMKDFSKFTITEHKETPEMKDFSQFTLAEPKETPEMKDFSEFTLAEPKETPEMKDFSEFTLTEPMETTEMKGFSEFTITEHKETPEVKDFSESALAEPKETPEMKDFSEFTLAEPKETPEMKDFSEFTLAEPKETPEVKDLSEFTLAEALEMERLYIKHGEDSQQQEICEELATKFSRSAIRDGKCIITSDQVNTWFVDRHEYSEVKRKRSGAVSDAARKPLPTINPSPIALKNLVALSKAWADAKIPTKPKAKRVAELPDLMFEALSSKDSAWYDVAVFLNFRVMYTGEMEVRVRFSGFSHDEDEWVNARNGVRERSIPLVASECHKVKVGDLVLCYRANEDHALYSDAHVVKIERQLHDDANCTCSFVVRFEYDNAEVELQCSEMCTRPS